MPVFEERGASIYEAPGLTPAILGLALAFCGFVLTIRKTKDGEKTDLWGEVLATPDHRRRALWAALITVGYGVLAFANLPFKISTALFVFGFIMIFDERHDDTPINWPKRALLSAVIAIVVAFGVSYLFTDLFLVQLP
jgi:hypothetical protein